MKVTSVGVKKIFKIKNKMFSYKKLEVVNNLNYEFKQGEIIAIMGASNSGKSTIVNLLSGRIRPSEGKIYVDDEFNYKKLKENSVIITDLHNKKLLNNESVYNNLVYFGNKCKIDALDIEKKIVELRDVLELEKVINKKVNELNELEEVKLNVAISLLKNPLVVYFDNALVNFDSVTKNMILKLLKRVNKEMKTTIVIASVDLMDIEKICKRVSVVQSGEIVIDDDFESVKKKYWNEKNVSITFNKSFNIPKGDFQIMENSDYFLKIKIDFDKFDFASLINQFDINTIIDINIASVNVYK